MLNTQSAKLAWVGFVASLLVSSLQAQEANKLTAQETEMGYDLLFNGTNLSNWHAYRQAAVTDAWTVKTNAPLGPRIENQEGTKLPILTNKKYKNFDLKVDVMVNQSGNSGIFTRYEENATSFQNFRTGPEMQLCGPDNHDCAGTTKHHGSCYDMFGVKESIRNTWYKAPGQWNQFRIVVYDSNYVHYGNGQKLLEYKIGSPDFIRAYNASKYVDDGNNGRYYDIHPGGILLQHHGENGQAFRNIKVKELEIHPFKQEFPDGKWPDVLSQDFTFRKLSSHAVSPEMASPLALSVTQGASGMTLVTVSSRHADFRVSRIDGRAVPFRKMSESVYSIARGNNLPGIVIVRLRAGGSTLTKIVNLQ
jgi:hypothetical protein